MIAIIDYGVGNIKAFYNIYKRFDIPVKIARKAEDLNDDITKLILPGVGAFDHAMQQLDNSGMRPRLNELVLDKEMPVIGICVGMQMLGNSSDEGVLPGLSWIKGEVKKFDISLLQHYQTRLPHMGWNDVNPVSQNPLFKELEKDALFYFLHSYYFHCERKEDIMATADYGGQFACAVNHKNIYGVQFHPEKSHHYGTQLLKNFANL